jgi:hypothetical protein
VDTEAVVLSVEMDSREACARDVRTAAEERVEVEERRAAA